MKKKYLILLGLSFLIIALDQITKMYIHNNFKIGESITVINNFFNFTYVKNYGAAFGFLNDSHPVFREIFFLSMPPFAILIILYILKNVPNHDTWQIVALSSIFGGAIGNYIDRLRFRYVIDFLDFHYKNQWSYPAFNVADSAIVGGVGVLLVLMVFETKREAQLKAQKK